MTHLFPARTFRMLRPLILIVMAWSAPAGITTTALTGRVTSGGAPAAGVTVTVSSPSLQGERSTVTTASGIYWLTALPPGKYDVTFSRAGLQTLTKRAVLELARVARADAALEPSADEESITSTAITVSVTDTPELTTHFSDQTLDRLPIRRSAEDAALIASGPGLEIVPIIDDALPAGRRLDSQEAVEQITILRGGLPADYEPTGAVAVTRIRSGGDALSIALRDTFSDQSREHLLELAAGGPLIPQRLWFFASGWRGGDRSAMLARVTARLGSAHSVSALSHDQTVVRYGGMLGPWLTNELAATSDAVSARSTYVLGAHILSAGAQLGDRDGFFLNDRWVMKRLTLNLGGRHADGDFSPRAAAVFDLRGNGRHAVVAYLAEDDERSVVRLGYAAAVGNTGSVRVDLLRDGVEATFLYSLFDRFQTGANYTESERDSGNAWFTLEMPFDERKLAVTLFERYAEAGNERFLTDVALRYALPIGDVALTAAVDLLDLFHARELRAWLRLQWARG